MIEWCEQAAGNLSILFDVGGVLGGALAGSLSDKCGAAASVSAAFVLASVPAMLLYRSYGHLSLGWNVFLMAAAGCFVNGPYALITTAVSADLGNHSSVAGAVPSQAAGVAWSLGLCSRRRLPGYASMHGAMWPHTPPLSGEHIIVAEDHCSLQTAQPARSLSAANLAVSSQP